MSHSLPRRDAIRLLAGSVAQSLPAAPSAELRLAAATPRTIRLTIVKPGAPPVTRDGSLLEAVFAKQGEAMRAPQARLNGLTIEVERAPLSIRISRGKAVLQKLTLDDATDALSFDTSGGPILGLGEGGPQFDRRGTFDEMKNGQGGYRERTHGARVPIPWVIGTNGWAIFVHQPWGKFDFRDRNRAQFLPSQPGATLDLFFTAGEPGELLEEFARLTGMPDMPPLWSFGYQQSHRTLAGIDEILGVARTFREKKLPCDVLIYLGAGFAPTGWNTGHESFTFDKKIIPDPKAFIDTLHKMNYRVALHVVYRKPELRGSAADACPTPGAQDQAGCYWQMHRPVFDLGIDGWWPDEGDQLGVASRLNRDRLYYEGPLSARPNTRPFALHRSGYAGTQRYGAFLWSGDVGSRWETLATHVPVAINTSLSGLPYWGTDTGGFVPSKELTGELYVRWFQFSAFCPLFRSHGRTWKLRLPWQWNTGILGPAEAGKSGVDPDVSELHNPDVEPICRKYLELRYRLMPYLYSLVRECHETAMPIQRALWLHYPDDPLAVLRSTEYLWGRDILVAPVVEKGATSRRLYLPRGEWYDVWDNSRHAGGREIERKVDLETMPLYVRAGAIIPFGPVRQYTTEPSDEPIQLTIYPGASGKFVLYEDDGVTYNFRRGDYSEIRCEWNEGARELTLRRLHGESREQSFTVRIVPAQATRRVVLRGSPVKLRF